jgi:hypothetical protein
MSRVFNQDAANVLTATVGVAASRANYTLFSWVKADAAFTGGTQQIIAFDNFFNKPRLYLVGATTSPCELRGSSADPGDDGSPEEQTEDQPIAKGTWEPCAVVVTPTQIFVRSGASNNTNVSTTDAISTAVTTLRIGSGQSLDPFGGKVAHVAAWKRALTTTELDDLMAGANPSSIGPGNRWFYYPLTDTGLSNIWTPTDSDTAGVLTVNGTVTSDAGDNPSVSGGGGGSAAAAAHYYRRRRAA